MTTATSAVPAVPKAVEPSAVPVAIEAPGITLIANVDDRSEGNKCSCAAGDDNPF